VRRAQLFERPARPSLPIHRRPPARACKPQTVLSFAVIVLLIAYHFVAAAPRKTQ
jgi:hypothetical protein